MSSQSAANVTAVAPGIKHPLAILFSPKAFYENLRTDRAPSFWLPVLLIAIASWSFTALCGTLVGFDQISANEMASRGITVSDPSAAATISAVIMLSWPVTFSITILLAGLVLYAIFPLGLGYNITLRQLFAVLFSSCLPRVFKYALCMLSLYFVASAREHFLPSNPVPTNPGYFLADAGFSPEVMIVLTSLDLFTFWSAALVAWGIATLSRRSFAATAGIVGVCWAVSLVLNVLMH